MKNDDRRFAIICTSALLITAATFLAVNGSQVIVDRSTPAATTTPVAHAAVERPPVHQDAGLIQATPPPEDAAIAVGVSEPIAVEEASERGFDLEAIIAAVADGRTPATLRAELPSLDEVLVREDGDGRLVVAAGTRRQYDGILRAIAALDPEAAAAAARGLTEAVDSQQGGGPVLDPWTEQQLRTAVDHLLAVPVPAVEPTMRSTGTRWDFADPDYRQLSEIQKHLLLMGRHNARTVQAKLIDLKLALGWIEAAQPHETRLAQRDQARMPEPTREEHQPVALHGPVEVGVEP